MRWVLAFLALASMAAEPVGDIEVSIEGPAAVDDGGFALVGSGQEDAVLRWRVETPEGGTPPLRLLDQDGNRVLVFLSPSPGRYRVWLIGQVPSEGLDPWGEAAHVTVVGPRPDPEPTPPGPGPEPTPPDPEPEPLPDNLSASVAEVIAKIDTPSKGEERSGLAQLYGRLAPQVAAGTLDFDALMVELREGHADAVGPSIAAWSPLFRLLAEELAANSDDNTAIARILNAVAKGLE